MKIKSGAVMRITFWLLAIALCALASETNGATDVLENQTNNFEVQLQDDKHTGEVGQDYKDSGKNKKKKNNKKKKKKHKVVKKHYHKKKKVTHKHKQKKKQKEKRPKSEKKPKKGKKGKKKKKKHKKVHKKKTHKKKIHKKYKHHTTKRKTNCDEKITIAEDPFCVNKKHPDHCRSGYQFANILTLFLCLLFPALLTTDKVPQWRLVKIFREKNSRAQMALTRKRKEIL